MLTLQVWIELIQKIKVPIILLEINILVSI